MVEEGVYEVTLTVTVNARQRVDLTMQVASVAESVTVTVPASFDAAAQRTVKPFALGGIETFHHQNLAVTLKHTQRDQTNLC